MANKLLLIALLILGTRLANGDDTEVPSLECYSCLSTEGDTTCEDDPDSYTPLSTIDCELGENQCCTILRRDLNDDLGVAIDFARGCQEDCPQDSIGKMIETVDWTGTTYQTYCDEPKCNSGPGNVQPGSNNGGGESIGIIQGVDGSPSVRGVASVVATGTLTATAGGRIIHEGL